MHGSRSHLLDVHGAGRASLNLTDLLGRNHHPAAGQHGMNAHYFMAGLHQLRVCAGSEPAWSASRELACGPDFELDRCLGVLTVGGVADECRTGPKPTCRLAGPSSRACFLPNVLSHAQRVPAAHRTQRGFEASGRVPCFSQQSQSRSRAPQTPARASGGAHECPCPSRAIFERGTQTRGTWAPRPGHAVAALDRCNQALQGVRGLTCSALALPKSPSSKILTWPDMSCIQINKRQQRVGRPHFQCRFHGQQ